MLSSFVFLSSSLLAIRTGMGVNMADQLLRLLSRFRQCFTKPARDGGDSKKVHIVLSFFFLVNYQLGMGFLGLPFGFFHGGILAGALTLAVMCLLCYGTAMWLLEVLSRAQVIIKILLFCKNNYVIKGVYQCIIKPCLLV